MKTTLKTLEYIWRRFFYLFPFVFIPALIISILPRTASNFIVFNYLQEAFVQAKTANFADIYLGITKNGRIETLYLLIVMLTIVPAFLATATGLIQRDMRIGNFNYRAAFRQLNRSLLQTLLAIIILLIIVQIYLLFISIFCYLLKLALLEHPKTLITFTSIIVLVLTILIVTVCSIFCTVIPEMIYTGKSFIAAIPNILTKTKDYKLDITVCALIPTIFSYVILYLTCYINIVPLKIIISLFIIFINMMYMVVMINVAYFEINNIERKDLQNNKIKIKKI